MKLNVCKLLNSFVEQKPFQHILLRTVAL